jgi:hypothetical protein
MRAIITFVTFIIPVSVLGYLFFGNVPTHSYEEKIVVEKVIPLPILRVKTVDEIEKPADDEPEPDPKLEGAPLIKDPMFASTHVKSSDPEKVVMLSPDGCPPDMHFKKAKNGIPLECVRD